MKFVLDDDQRAFASSLDSLLSSADTVAVARAWADGDHEPGLELWSRLAEQGVTSLADEPVFLAVAFERLGYHAVPGPWVESVAYLRREDGIGTVAVPPHVPFALDADVTDREDVGALHRSVDRTRRLFAVSGEEEPDADAFDRAVLAVAAQLLGLGERVLDDSVAYVKQRKQFGREIGSYQAVKHALADVRIALDFARPLVFGAALGALRDGSSLASSGTVIPASAAKVAAGDAAYRAARTGLQVHGAIGYTAEFDLSVWLTKIRALVTAWGTPAVHRARLLDGLTS